MDYTGQTVTIKAGSGYWDCTDYPIGGSFRRAAEPIRVSVMRMCPPTHGAEVIGETADGRFVAVAPRNLAEWRLADD